MHDAIRNRAKRLHQAHAMSLWPPTLLINARQGAGRD
jgi:hypothetical protein